jgi:metallo-beta-lactamase family protein
LRLIAYSLGAAEEVTGSKHFLDINGDLIQIDCGAFQGKRKESDEKNRNFNIDINRLKSVILTHGHFDHVGVTPLLVKNGYKGPIYSTSATRDIANLVMLDSAKIQYQDYQTYLAAARRKGDKTGKTVLKPLYNEEDCINTACQISTIPYHRRINLIKNCDIQLFDAGHILGSAMVELYIKNESKFFDKILGKANDKEVRVLYTGDLGRPEKPIIKKPDENVDAPDYIYLESTYGNRLHEGKEVALEHFAKVIRETAAKGGKVLIPSFAIERTQEIIYYLNTLLRDKKIPKLPVYVDSPMATNATGIFRVHPECYDTGIYEEFLDKHKSPFQFDKLTFVGSNQDSMKLDKKKDPCIIIAADGMCEAGRITHHLAAGIEDPKNTILIVGYMAENTLGRKLLDGEKTVSIFNALFNVNASVEKINAFSAHADYKETINWLNSIDTSRLKKIFLVHGEPESQTFLRKALIDEGYKNVEIVKSGTKYIL